MGSRSAVLENRVFGLLIAYEYLGNTVWRCRCICGVDVEVTAHALLAHETLSCDCTPHAEIVARMKPERRKNTKHGETATRLYRIWCSMKSLCSHRNGSFNQYYVARGIKVCTAWEHDYIAFRDWSIRNGYNPDNPDIDNLKLVRIDKAGMYEPGNCQFIRK